MKFVIQREDLLKPLQMIAGVIERRQTLPILSNALINVSSDRLTLTGTDLEVEMLASTTLENAEAGEITVPARKFMDICRALPAEAMIEIKLEKERVVIRSGKSRFVLSTLSASDFPNIDVDLKVNTFTLPESTLKSLINKTYFCMANQDVRYYLNGVLFELGDDSINMVATDGHRLALCGMNDQGISSEQHSVIIPRKGVLELMKLLGDDDKDIEIQLGSNVIRVSTDEMTFTSKLTEGRFPDYKNVIPRDGDKAIICDRDVLAQVLNRVSILSNEKYRGIRLQLSSGLLKVSAQNPEQEEAEEDLVIDYQGDDLEIGFNVSYMSDAIAACDDGPVQLNLSDQNSSCLIHAVDDDQCKYVVMPMRL